jgi:dCMP deaminase
MTSQELKWHCRFMRLALQVSKWSKDPSTKVGCVLVRDKKVLSTGYNGFPRRVGDDLNRLSDRDIKYEITVHAEVNAVTTAALHGISTEGATAYVTFNPCSRCAAVLLNAGIDSVYSYAGADIPNRWLENFILASRLFAEAEVKYDTIDPDSYPEES